MVGGPIVVRHRSFGPAHRTLAPKVRSTRPQFAAPARPGLRLGRVESLVRATAVCGLTTAICGRDHRSLRSTTAISNRKLRSPDRKLRCGRPQTALRATANCGVAMSKSKLSKVVSEAEIGAQDRALLKAFLNTKVVKRPAPPPLKQPKMKMTRVTSYTQRQAREKRAP